MKVCCGMWGYVGVYGSMWGYVGICGDKPHQPLQQLNNISYGRGFRSTASVMHLFYTKFILKQIFTFIDVHIFLPFMRPIFKSFPSTHTSYTNLMPFIKVLALLFISKMENICISLLNWL